ncbi:DUF3027 domain-containing protein [Streptomyces sp. N2-109]|uniref:DUF3027 domain-containing protein n=1 Tax=Streptomyces gossypii TaxID=2883101 RepID=A0ABT2JXX1_9ACTN|nr:DUF3027 domain-containing protein [Streptomyces gossypii]MCT2592730.1 DUF3027 domain-containing protein [Streptomyces gossypii]
MSAATRNRRTPDRLCAEAVELAREAAQATAAPGRVGDWIEAVADGDRVVTHLFECHEPGYRGWRWATTVARASRAKVVTLDETVLLPGPDSLLAPEWLPWSERLRPGDLGPGDLLPSEAEDLRLEPGYSGADGPPPNSPMAEPEMAAGVEAEQVAEASGLADAEDADLLPGSPAALARPPERGSIQAVAEELGMARARVLSRYGLHSAADRWEEAHGPDTPMAQAAPASCVSCGFLVPLTGSLRQAFGVCANEFSPADGQVVSLTYGCGAHSEAAVMPKPPQPPPPVIDETRADALSLHSDDSDDSDDGDGSGADDEG